MSADQITPERVEELRERVTTGGPTKAWRRSDYLAVLDALTASRAEVQRLTEELDSANADAEGAERLISSLRTNLQEKIAQVQRLTEIEVSEECYGMLTAHGSDGIMLVGGEFASGREFREKYRARRSDAGRVEVPEISLEDGEAILRSFPASLPAWEDGNWSLAFNKVADFLRVRLSPSPQPSADVVVVPREEHQCTAETCDIVDHTSDYYEKFRCRVCGKTKLVELPE